MNEDKIITMLLDHEDRLERIEENMATKKDVRNLSQTLDHLVHLAEKKDQELTMIAHGHGRHGQKIEQHDKDILRIKPLVGLA